MRKQIIALFIFVLGNATAFAQVDLSSGLVGNYPFSGNANDLGSAGNNGTANGGANLTTDRQGCSNAAYNFDGTDDNISFGTTGLNNNNLTYAAWVYIDVLPTNGNAVAVMAIGNTGGDQSILIGNNYNAQTGFIASSYTSSVTLVKSESGTLPSTGTWYHVVYTRTTNEVTLYINGAQADQDATGGNVAFYNTPVNARIGSRTNGIQWFDGKIDDVRIYDRALSDCEVQALYALDPINLNNGLIGNYPFSNNANDLSKLNNDGAVSGASLANDRNSTANSAYSFDGTNDKITLSGAGLNNANYTYTAWVYVNANPTNGNGMAILSIGNAGGDQTIFLGNNYGGTITGFTGLSYQTTAPVTVASSTTGSLPSVGTWYHLAFTRDNSNVTLYVNGAQVDQDATSANALYNGTVNAKIGTRSTDIQWFNGRVDDVRIYDRALSDCEVLATYNATAGSATNPNGLIGSYYFNNNAADLSGFGNHGTVNGAAATTSRFSAANTAYDFDGTDDNITIGATGLDNSQYSYSAWVYIDALPANSNAFAVVSVGASGGDQAIMVANNYNGHTGFMGSSYYSLGVGPDAVETNSLPSTATWYHLVLTRDNSNLTLYVDGVQADQQAVSSNPPFYNTPLAARIGTRPNDIQWFNGRIDDVRIYNRAVSACEVEKLYSETSSSNPGARVGMSFGEGQTNFAPFAYPNPATGQLYINTAELKGESYKCTMLNAFGQTVNCSFNYYEHTANLNGLPKGVYLLQIESGGEKRVQKILIEQ